MASHVMTPAERMRLHSAARDLHVQFRGIFGQETIESEIRPIVTRSGTGWRTSSRSLP
jgi:hypothetical protein